MGLLGAVRTLRGRLLGIRHATLAHYEGLLGLPLSLSKADVARLVAEAERASQRAMHDQIGVAANR